MARPREFEPEDALAQIMDVFWRKGYEGASLHDIEAATGLNKQSLYRVFEDKRGMYLAALRRYEETEIAAAVALLEKSGSARQRFQRIFTEVIKQAAPGGDRRGCFLCNASADQAQLDKATRKYVRAMVERVEGAFRSALKASPPYDRDEKSRNAMAAKLLAAYFGMRVLVKSNASLDTLKSAARQLVAEI